MTTTTTKQTSRVRCALFTSIAAILVFATANVTAADAEPQPVAAPEPTYIIIGERLMVCNPFPECRDVGENDDEDDQG
ncbi:MAG: hypothetical protein J0M22_15875 [Gammaproteobacteria bacterium]|jgi:hypothetical protein|nr:hypothetical protein [Gammaproteobacteria bacterium]